MEMSGPGPTFRRGKYTGSLPTKSNICFVAECRSKYLQKLSVPLSFFKIPKIESFPEIHQNWKTNLGLTRKVSWLRICELHFTEDCFLRDLEAELTGRPIRQVSHQHLWLKTPAARWRL